MCLWDDSGVWDMHKNLFGCIRFDSWRVLRVRLSRWLSKKCRVGWMCIEHICPVKSLQSRSLLCLWLLSCYVSCHHVHTTFRFSMPTMFLKLYRVHGWKMSVMQYNTLSGHYRSVSPISDLFCSPSQFGEPVCFAVPTGNICRKWLL